MYGLVTHMAEVIGKDTWENLLTDHLLKPLEMNQTVFASTADIGHIPNFATGYLEDQNKLLPVHHEFMRLESRQMMPLTILSCFVRQFQTVNF